MRDGGEERGRGVKGQEGKGKGGEREREERERREWGEGKGGEGERDRREGEMGREEREKEEEGRREGPSRVPAWTPPEVGSCHPDPHVSVGWSRTGARTSHPRGPSRDIACSDGSANASGDRAALEGVC